MADAMTTRRRCRLGDSFMAGSGEWYLLVRSMSANGVESIGIRLLMPTWARKQGRGKLASFLLQSNNSRRGASVAKIPAGVGPRFPQVVVLFGATGDLARRKLLPGLFHLVSGGFIPGCRIVGVSLDEIGVDDFRAQARSAIDEFFTRKVSAEDWQAFAATLDYLPLSAGPEALKSAVDRAEQSLGSENRRLHYLSVPPNAALAAVQMLGQAGLVDRSRIVMEKPFGTDLASAVEPEREAARGVRRAADLPHRSLPWQGAGAEHPRLPFCQRPVRADLEPQLHRPRANRRSRNARARHTCRLLRGDRRISRHGGHPPVPDPCLHGDGATHLAGTGTDQRRKEQGLSQHAADPAGRRGARPIYRLPIAGRRIAANPKPKPSSR